jgi:thioredoxin-related protein
MLKTLFVPLLAVLLSQAALAQTTAPSAGIQPKSPRTTTPTVNTPKAKSEVTTAPATTGRNPKPSIPARTTTKGSTAPQPVKAAVATEAIKWMSIEEALEKSKTEKRKIFVDVYTGWCGWCKKMDSSTFTDPTVVKYLNEKYYAVKFDAEQQKDIAYKGQTYKFKKTGEGGYHELAALWLNNRLSYPSFVFLDEDQNLIQGLAGYQEAAKLDAILHYFGTDNHKKTPWEKYERNYSRER